MVADLVSPPLRSIRSAAPAGKAFLPAVIGPSLGGPQGEARAVEGQRSRGPSRENLRRNLHSVIRDL
jgi:hypothetical protein